MIYSATCKREFEYLGSFRKYFLEEILSYKKQNILASTNCKYFNLKVLYSISLLVKDLLLNSPIKLL